VYLFSYCQRYYFVDFICPICQKRMISVTDKESRYILFPNHYAKPISINSSLMASNTYFETTLDSIVKLALGTYAAVASSTGLTSLSTRAFSLESLLPRERFSSASASSEKGQKTSG
jgi:hypothetical protein